ncbi:hypothetical protein SALBM135S_05965 [Streptomyces alboniger]
MEVPGALRLGPQDPREPLGGQRVEDAVVEVARGVHDGAERMLGGDRVEHLREGVPVGDIAGHDGHLRTRGDEFGGQLRRPRRVRAAPAEQQQTPGSALGHQVPGEHAAQGAGAAGDQDGVLGSAGAAP